MKEDRRLREELEPEAFSHEGFALSFTVDSAQATLPELLEALLYEVLRPLALECGGGSSGSSFQGFVIRWKGSATKEDRRAVSVWMDARPEVVRYDVGELVAAWYGV